MELQIEQVPYLRLLDGNGQAFVILSVSQGQETPNPRIFCLVSLRPMDFGSNFTHFQYAFGRLSSFAFQGAGGAKRFPTTCRRS